MALAHFHAGVVSRGAGRSAVEAAAYVVRANFIDERTGDSYSNARNARDAVRTFVWLPKNAPEQYRDAETLANYMEQRETRVNSRTARTIEGALPHELTDEQRERLVKNFARELTRKGLAVIVGIHKPHEHGDERNHHFHMVISTRTMDAHGLGAKLRELDKVETLEAWRDRFEILTNSQLERAGHAARIDMRSFERQGIDGTPQVHLGPVAAALERKGIATDRGDQWNSVAEDRQQGRAWTAGKPRQVEVQAEALPVVSASERQAEDERKERAAVQREASAAEARSAAVPLHLRMIASAMRFLRVNLVGTLANTMGQVDDATIRASMREAKAAQIPRREKTPKPAPKISPEPELRQFVDRGRRPAPYRALLGEMRDADHEQQQGPANDNGSTWLHDVVWRHDKPVTTPDVVRDRDAGGSTSSEVGRSEAAPAAPAPPLKGTPKPLRSWMDAQQDLRREIPRPKQRDREQDRDRGYDWDLDR